MSETGGIVPPHITDRIPGHETDQPPTEREMLRRILTEAGMADNGGTPHGWRCQYPDIYPGYCRCVDEMIDGIIDGGYRFVGFSRKHDKAQCGFHWLAARGDVRCALVRDHDGRHLTGDGSAWVAVGCESATHGGWYEGGER